MSLAERFKELRERAGYSQAELAEAASTLSGRRITQQSVADIESGTVKVSRALDELAAALKTTGQYLKWGELGVTLGHPRADLQRMPLAAMADNLPVYLCEPESNGHGEPRYMTVKFTAASYASRPSHLRKSKKAFGACVRHADMSPAYEVGDLVLVDPRGKLRPGKDYLFLSSLRRPARAVVRRLLKATSLHWEVAQFNPAKRARLARKEFPHALLVAGVYRAE
jgi:transcriptional regulator with XRE-family HTH domain